MRREDTFHGYRKVTAMMSLIIMEKENFSVLSMCPIQNLFRHLEVC